MIEPQNKLKTQKRFTTEDTERKQKTQRAQRHKNTEKKQQNIF